MKKFTSLLIVAILGGVISLGTYKLFEPKQEDNNTSTLLTTANTNPDTSRVFRLPTSPVNHNNTALANLDIDFTKAANETVHAVVHVKNVSIGRAPRTISEYMMGMRAGKRLQGAGSGVIITPNGYIVTNNHVIKGANEIEVTLNNNLTYKAKLIGSDPQADIALIKIEAEELDYLPFGDSDQVKIGEWALAVGNPFNLTSTVTAGIISAKGRDLNDSDTQMQSFIQTDAAINPGNSGGALVNTRGELIGINTAISSQTGSYIGYGFAVPSNNAKKIVEDLLEYGDVQQAIIGITGGTINPEIAENKNISITQGVYIDSVSDGAEAAGLQHGDLITAIDNINVRKISDLTAYIRTKRPNDIVKIKYIRQGNVKQTDVKLTKYETYTLDFANIEVTNANKTYLAEFKADYGVRISKTLSRDFQIPKDQYIITAINNYKINSVTDVKNILEQTPEHKRITLTFQNRKGYQESYTFRH
ncbi:Do/DeqQ family serine protease [Mesonia hippocampi]|uniref:Do/DeqQ family serine protease n=1 Tax=Mesonia hippocampi TaxID=1628250 RepID=A0A840EF09_9FLAO|nr:trypsin-like peptidase domain-containing protein [Mesonia hippocampi]MBB4117772.1 Do/DeqQ family serine protease [Mesonia hippocampi]